MILLIIMHKRKPVILVVANTEVSSTATDITSHYGVENSYCGYCCKLIEIKSQSSEEVVAASDVLLPDDNNYEYIILCASCKGPFHVSCTALSATPIEMIREQCLNWKCNTCVKNEAPNVSQDSTPDETDTKTIDYEHRHRDDLIDKRLSAMLCMFGKDSLQNVCGRIVETDDIDKELEGVGSRREECLAIVSIPVSDKDRFLQEISSVAAAKGIKLITQPPPTPLIISDKVSFVIRLDPHATRQLLLNSYLNSIMHPITMQQQQTTKPTSFYLANDRDIEVSSTTCLLPHNNVPTSETGLSSNNRRSIYMYEYLSTNASSSAENQTMLVKAISGGGGGIGGDSDNDSVFHDERSNVIVPIIKISGVPKRVRLASKENFDDIEGKFINKLF